MAAYVEGPMNIILFLAPASIGLGALGLIAFFWTMRSGQYEDPKGDAARILYDHLDDKPPAED
jgi:cbb3-type cytochrome oxidase maturation protein